MNKNEEKLGSFTKSVEVFSTNGCSVEVELSEGRELISVICRGMGETPVEDITIPRHMALKVAEAIATVALQ